MSRLCDYETPDSENLNIVKMNAWDVLLSNYVQFLVVFWNLNILFISKTKLIVH